MTSSPEGSFPGGVLIEGNYLDFATNYSLGGYVSRKKVRDPNYRPDHENHESYLGFGILGSCIVGKAIIRHNIVRNMNARGIVFQDKRHFNATLFFQKRCQCRTTGATRR